MGPWIHDSLYCCYCPSFIRKVNSRQSGYRSHTPIPSFWIRVPHANPLSLDTGPTHQSSQSGYGFHTPIPSVWIRVPHTNPLSLDTGSTHQSRQSGYWSHTPKPSVWIRVLLTNPLSLDTDPTHQSPQSGYGFHTEIPSGTFYTSRGCGADCKGNLVLSDLDFQLANQSNMAMILHTAVSYLLTTLLAAGYIFPIFSYIDIGYSFTPFPLLQTNIQPLTKKDKMTKYSVRALPSLRTQSQYSYIPAVER